MYDCSRQKQVILSEETYTYDSNHFLFTAIDLPVIAQVLEASVEQPYLSIVLRLDPYLLAQIMLEAHIPFKDVNTEKKRNGCWSSQFRAE